MGTYRKFSQSVIRHINRGYLRGGDVGYRRRLSVSPKTAASTAPKAVATESAASTAPKAPGIPAIATESAAPKAPEIAPAGPGATVATEVGGDGVAAKAITADPTNASAAAVLESTSASATTVASEATATATAEATMPTAPATSESERIFGWKSYVGGILLSYLAYKNVGWYVDRVAEEGRLKREDVETRKVERVKYDEELKEMRARHAASLAEMEAMGRANSISQAQAQAVQTTAAQSAKVPSLSTPYVPVEQTDGFVSETDQLRSFRDELQAKLNGTSDADRRREIQEEITDIELEIEQLGGGAGSNTNSNYGIY